jgi:hypothetical protein
MYCPDYCVLRTKYLVVTMNSDRDVPRKYVPKTQWCNPLRYEVFIRSNQYSNNPITLTINKNGLWWIKYSNFIYKIKNLLWRK